MKRYDCSVSASHETAQGVGVTGVFPPVGRANGSQSRDVTTRVRRWACVGATMLALSAPLATAAADRPSPVPLPRAHAHNDYEHTRPLIDALEHGFCSVEADVWLVEGRLLVAHDRKDAKPERTLERLYLEPLRERVATNGGRVYRGGPSLTLLVDVKSDATNTWLAVRAALEPYEKILTRFHTNRTETNAVTVIISGNRARDLMAAEPSRLAAYDGRLDDLESGASPHFIPLVSDNWSRQFKWRAGVEEGPLPDAERKRLRELIARAHEQGRRMRWWATPDRAAMWTELFDAGADLINTDDLPGLQRFLIAPERSR